MALTAEEVFCMLDDTLEDISDDDLGFEIVEENEFLSGEGN